MGALLPYRWNWLSWVLRIVRIFGSRCYVRNPYRDDLYRLGKAKFSLEFHSTGRWSGCLYSGCTGCHRIRNRSGNQQMGGFTCKERTSEAFPSKVHWNWKRRLRTCLLGTLREDLSSVTQTVPRLDIHSQQYHRQRKWRQTDWYCEVCEPEECEGIRWTPLSTCRMGLQAALPFWQLWTGNSGFVCWRIGHWREVSL